MTKTFAAVAALAASFAFVANAAQLVETTSEADLGTWRVARLLFFKDYGPTNGLTRTQAQNSLGKTLVITKNGIAKMAGKPCPPHRVVDIDQRDRLLMSDNLPPDLNLGLPEKVIVFTYGCMGFWLRTDGNMVAAVESYYFELRRVVEAAPRKRAKNLR
jgi:hypothetical protein